MFVIVLYFISFLIIAFIGNHLRSEKRVSFETITSFMLLFIFFGFRDLPILNDTAHYYSHFQGLVVPNWDAVFSVDPYDRFEYGYQIFEKIIAKLFQDPYSIIMSSALIITVSNLQFIKKYTTHVALTVFVFLTQMILLFQYSAIRQSLAICCFYVAFRYLLNGKLLQYYILTLFAISFHSSAIILLIVPLIVRIPLNTKTIIVFVLAASVIGFYMTDIINLLGFGSSIYLETDLNRDTTALGALLKLILMVIFIVISLLLLRDTKIAFIDQSLIWLSLMGLIFSTLSLKLMIMGRFAGYFVPFTAILLIRAFFHRPSDTHGAEHSANSVVLGLILGVLFAQIIVVLTFRPEWYHLVPYSFYDFGMAHINVDFGY